MPKFDETGPSFGFRVQDQEDEVPGFRVPSPEDQVPGFNLPPDGSLSDGPFGSSIHQEQSTSATPLSYFGSQAPGSNLDFLTGIQPDPSSGFQPVAAGDLKCQGGDCTRGGDRGTTAAYQKDGRPLCVKCLIRKLGYEEVPSSELPTLLVPWMLGGS